MDIQIDCPYCSEINDAEVDNYYLAKHSSWEDPVTCISCKKTFDVVIDLVVCSEKRVEYGDKEEVQRLPTVGKD